MDSIALRIRVVVIKRTIIVIIVVVKGSKTAQVNRAPAFADLRNVGLCQESSPTLALIALRNPGNSPLQHQPHLLPANKCRSRESS